MSTRVVVVLGYSDTGRGELHPVCAARLARAAEVTTSDDVVVLSGWARVPHMHSEADLMLRRLARGRSRGRRRPGRAHHGREHGERPQRRPPRGRPRGARRHLVVARPAREGRPPLAPAPHGREGALDGAGRAVAEGDRSASWPCGRSSRSSSGSPGARAGRPEALPATPPDGLFVRSVTPRRVSARRTDCCPQPIAP